jgi:hypothetical protein
MEPQAAPPNAEKIDSVPRCAHLTRTTTWLREDGWAILPQFPVPGLGATGRMVNPPDTQTTSGEDVTRDGDTREEAHVEEG